MSQIKHMPQYRAQQEVGALKIAEVSKEVGGLARITFTDSYFLPRLVDPETVEGITRFLQETPAEGEFYLIVTPDGSQLIHPAADFEQHFKRIS